MNLNGLNIFKSSHLPNNISLISDPPKSTKSQTHLSHTLTQYTVYTIQHWVGSRHCEIRPRRRKWREARLLGRRTLTPQIFSHGRKLHRRIPPPPSPSPAAALGRLSFSPCLELFASFGSLSRRYS